MKIAISPCPNDTYLFYGWVKGLVGPAPEVVYADVQQLNEWAVTDAFDLIKISYAMLPKVKYELLPIGMAVGPAPLLIGKEPFKTVAVPGRDTTANQLLGDVEARKVFCRYDEVFDLLREGIVDAGVIIHELRFTYRDAGFSLIRDLGGGEPVPLGCLVARDQSALSYLKKSLALAREGHPGLMPYILEHSQEMVPEVVQKHINAYVAK